MQEEYFSADRLLELNIGTVIQILEERTGELLSASLIGIEQGRMVITSMPVSSKDSSIPTNSLLNDNASYEMKCIHKGKIVAWEANYKSTYQSRLLMTSFPEMVETRKLRQDTRFPCALACDIRSNDDEETYGVITNISAGGCQISVKHDENHSILHECYRANMELDLIVIFPPDYEATLVVAAVKSAQQQIDGDYSFGLAFRERYNCIRRYLESLQLDCVTPFFR